MIQSFEGRKPDTARAAFVANGASVIGDVTLDEGSSVWYSAVVRGDLSSIHIGRNTNVQDGAILHTEADTPLLIGNDVTIGHGAVVHGSSVGNAVLIGMQATVLSGAVIGEGAVIGAGALVKENQVIKPHELVVGVPAKAVRTLDESRMHDNIAHAASYVELAKAHARIQPDFRID